MDQKRQKPFCLQLEPLVGMLDGRVALSVVLQCLVVASGAVHLCWLAIHRSNWTCLPEVRWTPQSGLTTPEAHTGAAEHLPEQASGPALKSVHHCRELLKHSVLQPANRISQMTNRITVMVDLVEYSLCPPQTINPANVNCSNCHQSDAYHCRIVTQLRHRGLALITPATRLTTEGTDHS